MSSVPLPRQRQIQDRAVAVNRYLYTMCSKDQCLQFINNDKLTLGDSIHLTVESKVKLAKAVTEIVRPSGPTLATPRQWVF